MFCMRGIDFGDYRGASPVVEVALMVIIVVLMATTAVVLVTDIADDQLDSAETVDVVVDRDRCAGDQTATYDGSFSEIQEQLQNDPCALWLESGHVETENGDVVGWSDQGQNSFDATAVDAQHLDVEESSELGGHEVVVFDPEDTEDGGGYFDLERDVSDFDLDEDSGIIVISVVQVEEYDRGGTWTIGEAGQDGREFSMRTCSDRGVDGCQTSEPEGEFRAQHWGSADVDFNITDASTVDSADDWVILTHGYDGDDAFIRANGEEIAREDVDLDLSEDRDIQIGRWERTANDPSWYFEGRMAEILFFDTDLEEEDIESIENALGDRLGIETDDD